jgi:hypothetical protein
MYVLEMESNGKFLNTIGKKFLSGVGNYLMDFFPIFLYFGYCFTFENLHSALTFIAGSANSN